MFSDAIQKPAIPFPESKILDSHGDTVRSQPRLTLMARIDAKATEKVEISRGTIWLLATALVLAGIVFSYGGSLLNWSREDEAQRVRGTAIQKDVEGIKTDLKELKLQFDDVQKSLQAQAIKDAEARGYELKSAEGSHGAK